MAHAFTDRWGCPVFAAAQQAVDVLDEAVEQLVALSGDPMALADEAAARDPQLVLARVLQGYLALYAGSASGLQRARALVGDLDPWGLETGERELLHVLAVQSWADGEWESHQHRRTRPLPPSAHAEARRRMRQDGMTRRTGSKQRRSRDFARAARLCCVSRS